MRPILLLAAAFVAISPPSAGADPIEFGDYELSITESLYVDWHQDNENDDPLDDRYVDVKNRLNLALRSNWLQAGLRLDVAQFLPQNRDQRGDEFADRYPNDITVEKFFVKVRERGFLLEAGDVYGTLGKGIALSVQKVDELSTDLTLRGAKGSYRGNSINFIALGGYSNIVNVGDRIEEYFDDPRDIVGGVQLGYSPFNWLDASVHTSYVKDNIEWDTIAQRGDHSRDYYWVSGGTVSFPNIFDLGSFLVEYDYVNWEDVSFLQAADGYGVTYPVKSNSGHAVYATGTFSYGWVNAVAEFKYYDGMGQGHNSILGKEIRSSGGLKDYVYYGVLPPLEDPGLFHRPTYYDQWGGRLRVDVALSDWGTQLYANYAHFDDLDDHEIEESDRSVRHVIVGVEQRLDEWSAGGSVQAGRRWDHLEFEWNRTMNHVDAELHFPIAGPFSIEASGRAEFYDEKFMPDFAIAKSALTLSMASYFSVTGTYEYSDQPPLGDGYFDRNYWAGEVLYRFTSDSYAKVFFGSTRGGLKCAGGMCRVFPAFEGVKGEVTLRF